MMTVHVIAFAPSYIANFYYNDHKYKEILNEIHNTCLCLRNSTAYYSVHILSISL